MLHFDFTRMWQKFRRVSRILWVRVAFILALSILAALSAKLLDPLIPQAPKDRFTAQATLPILTILANGMLAVATFSLGVMVSSHRTTAEQTTPRIHRLLMEDTSTQSMLATFIGAFAFSLSSIILFRAGYYSDSASVIVFAMTVFVVLAIIVSLIRWIHQLSRLGSMDYALERAEETASEIFEAMRARPNLGARVLDENVVIPQNVSECHAAVSGFLTSIELQSLQNLAEEHNGFIYIEVTPGDRVLSGQTLARFTGSIGKGAMAGSFLLEHSRSYEQDPRYAVQALRETASKALSPGINDPGTAVEVVTRLERILWDGLQVDQDETTELFDRLFISTPSSVALIELAFHDIARDGAAFIDVLAAILQALSKLRELEFIHDADLDDLFMAIDEYAEAGLSTASEQSAYQKLTGSLKVAAI
jgi:uncharacterized membrane protein